MGGGFWEGGGGEVVEGFSVWFPAKIGGGREGEERRRLLGLYLREWERERECGRVSLQWGEPRAAAVGESDGRDGTECVCVCVFLLLVLGVTLIRDLLLQPAARYATLDADVVCFRLPRS